MTMEHHHFFWKKIGNTCSNVRSLMVMLFLGGNVTRLVFFSICGCFRK